jgi:CBS domain-containing protein
MAIVSDIMTREVMTVPPDTSIRDVARLLCSKRISGLPVVDATGTLVGIISESDLMVHAASIGEDNESARSWWKSLFANDATLARHYAKTHGQTAGHVMSTNLQTVAEDAPVGEVARIMGQHKVKRLPVVRDGRMVGIVTRSDLLKILAGSAPSREGAPSDDAICEMLLKKLEDQPWAHLTADNIRVEHGVVKFYGSVRTEDESRALRIAAETIPGVVGVEDHLSPVVVPPVV